MSAYHDTADLAPVERRTSQDPEPFYDPDEVREAEAYYADELAAIDREHNDWPETYGY